MDLAHINDQQANVVTDGQIEFWKMQALKQDENCVRVNGEHYRIGPAGQEFRGFGGRKFIIEFHDGRTVETDNLWHQGTIPESYRRILPDNATMREKSPPPFVF